MFVSTEIDNPDPRVTRLIEDIVRNQLIEMVRCFSHIRLYSRGVLHSGGSPSTWRPKTSYF